MPAKAPAQESRADGPAVRRPEFSRSYDILSLRMTAAFSASGQERRRAAMAICDLDSAAFVLEHSPFEDSRSLAREALERRLDSFTDDVLRSLSASSGYEHIRSAAAKALAAR